MQMIIYRLSTIWQVTDKPPLEDYVKYFRYSFRKSGYMNITQSPLTKTFFDIFNEDD